MDVREEIRRALADMGIAFDEAVHEEVHTIGECRAIGEKLNAVVPKNLFLTPRDQSAFYLCLVRPNALFRTADVSKQIGSSRLSFGSEEMLSQLLRTHGGAVSPLGLLFDGEKKVRVLIDRTLLALPRLGFHPNDNTRTIAMAGDDFFHIFLPRLGRTATCVDLPDAQAGGT